VVVLLVALAALVGSVGYGTYLGVRVIFKLIGRLCKESATIVSGIVTTIEGAWNWLVRGVKLVRGAGVAAEHFLAGIFGKAVSAMAKMRGHG
jgi:hypothetical protein